MDKEVSSWEHDSAPPRLTILLVSAMALAYEILLMRLFPIVQYHHFAYMVISLALLGYGASGTFLVFFRQRFLQRFPATFIGNILLFGITVVACFQGAQHLLFNPDEMFWSNRQWLKLFALYLMLALPFFFAANCIALAFSRYRRKISVIYGADLIGAGVGSILIIVLLFLFLPHRVLLLLGSLIFVVGGVAWLELRLLPRSGVILFIGSAVIFFLLPASWTGLAISPYKGLSQQMRITGSRIVEEQSSPLALLTAVKNDLVPFRYAPGLSITAVAEPPEQLGIFIDGDAMNVITRFPEDISRLAYLDEFTTALGYHLQRPEGILILGAGAGADILQALYFAGQSITAVELNPQIVQMVQKRPDFSGHLFERENVHVQIDEARSFVAGSSKKFDLIALPLLYSFSSSAAGPYALNENYLYTVEALQEYIQHLLPGGYLSMSRWVTLPPRDTLKLFATAVAALKGLDRDDFAKCLVMIRSWQSATLLVKKSPFTGEEISRVKKFCQQRLFDLVYYPGMERQEANRFNILRRPYFYDGAVSLVGGESENFISRYKFNIGPSTDDRPFFASFFKWRTLPEILKLKGQGGMVLLESGYLILVITLLQALAASLVLILLPVIVRSGMVASETGWSRARVAAYFFVIGLGFLFLEIAFMQKFILYLGNPLYAAAVILAIFLIFAGMGSRHVQAKRIHAKRPAAMIIGLGAVDLFTVNYLFDALNPLPWIMKIVLAILLLGPLAFNMGMLFPLAMAGIGAQEPNLIPWAWSVNGCASVIAAVLATLLAVHLGFSIVVLAALALYGTAAVIFPAGLELNGGRNTVE